MEEIKPYESGRYFAHFKCMKGEFSRKKHPTVNRYDKFLIACSVCKERYRKNVRHCYEVIPKNKR